MTAKVDGSEVIALIIIDGSVRVTTFCETVNDMVVNQYWRSVWPVPIEFSTLGKYSSTKVNEVEAMFIQGFIV